MDLNNWSVGNNSWFMQKAQACLWKIKPEWPTQTDWNMDENHGNRLFSKQFIEAHSETQHLGKDSLVLISAYQHLQEQMCQAGLPQPLSAHTDQHEESAPDAKASNPPPSPAERSVPVPSPPTTFPGKSERTGNVG